jgi:hypothetical protein
MKGSTKEHMLDAWHPILQNRVSASVWTTGLCCELNEQKLWAVSA